MAAGISDRPIGANISDLPDCQHCFDEVVFKILIYLHINTIFKFKLRIALTKSGRAL